MFLLASALLVLIALIAWLAMPKGKKRIKVVLVCLAAALFNLAIGALMIFFAEDIVAFVMRSRV